MNDKRSVEWSTSEMLLLQTLFAHLIMFFQFCVKLLGQFVKVHKNQYFKRLENLFLDCMALFFLQNFEKLGFNLTP